MSYFAKPTERPRSEKIFLTVRQVEDLYANGSREILLAPNTVITDAAREAALDRGMKLTVQKVLTTTETNEPRSAKSASGGTNISAETQSVAPQQSAPGLQGTSEIRPPPKPIDGLVLAVSKAVRERWTPTVRTTRQFG